MIEYKKQEEVLNCLQSFSLELKDELRKSIEDSIETHLNKNIVSTAKSMCNNNFHLQNQKEIHSLLTLVEQTEVLISLVKKHLDMFPEIEPLF